jgi:hypothetical protein
MKTVTVKKSELLQKVLTNRDGHRAQFEKAWQGYRDECVKLLIDNLDALKADKMHVVRFFEQPPDDHTSDYNRVIAMLGMSVDENIELTQQEFQNYVQDDWDWKERWAASNMKYTNR